MKFINLHFKIRMFSCSKLTFWLSVFLIKVRLDKTLVGNLLKYPGAPKHLTLLCEFRIPPLLKVKSVTRGVWISGPALFSQDFIVKTREKCIFFPWFWNLTGDNGRIRQKSNLFVFDSAHLFAIGIILTSLTQPFICVKSKQTCFCQIEKSEFLTILCVNKNSKD